MALPQKAIEQLGREPVRTQGWSPRLLMAMGTVFFLSIAVYFGLLFGYKPFVKSQVAKVDGQIKSFSEQVPLADQQKIINFYSQLSNIRTIFEQQPMVSQILTWLEGHTQGNVFFTKFSLTLGSQQLALGGEAKSVEDVAEQIKVFEERKEVKRVSVENVSLAASGAWQFTATLVFDPKFVANPQAFSQ